MTTDDELVRMRSENVPDTMNTRPMDFDLRDERLAEQDRLTREYETAIADLGPIVPSPEHPFEDLAEQEAYTREVDERIEELRYKPDAEREELERRVEEAIAELDQRTPALEHPFEDLNGNPIEGEQPEIRDVRGEGLFRDDWTPPNSDMGLRFRVAAYGLDPENLGGTVHAIRQAEDPDAMRERILAIQYRSGFTVERILEDALIVGLLYLASEGEVASNGSPS